MSMPVCLVSVAFLTTTSKQSRDLSVSSYSVMSCICALTMQGPWQYGENLCKVSFRFSMLDWCMSALCPRGSRWTLVAPGGQVYTAEPDVCQSFFWLHRRLLQNVVAIQKRAVGGPLVANL